MHSTNDGWMKALLPCHNIKPPAPIRSCTMKSTCMLILAAVAPSAAFVAPSQPRTHTALAAQKSRTEFLRDVAAVGIAAATTAGAALPAFADEVTASGVSIKVSKEGKGPKPEIGELAAIRFAAFAGENKIDDIFDTPEPYYTRVGSGGLIKGVEEVLPKMRVGDRWVLTVPVSEMPSLSYIMCTQYFNVLWHGLLTVFLIANHTMHPHKPSGQPCVWP